MLISHRICLRRDASRRASEVLATSIWADETLDDSADTAAATVAPRRMELGLRDD